MLRAHWPDHATALPRSRAGHRPPVKAAQPRAGRARPRGPMRIFKHKGELALYVDAGSCPCAPGGSNAPDWLERVGEALLARRAHSPRRPKSRTPFRRRCRTTASRATPYRRRDTAVVDVAADDVAEHSPEQRVAFRSIEQTSSPFLQECSPRCTGARSGAREFGGRRLRAASCCRQRRARSVASTPARRTSRIRS